MHYLVRTWTCSRTVNSGVTIRFQRVAVVGALPQRRIHLSSKLPGACERKLSSKTGSLRNSAPVSRLQYQVFSGKRNIMTDFILQTTAPRHSTENGKVSTEAHDQFYVGAIDQGTTSTRFIVFNHAGEICSSHQLEHGQIYPQAGWCEHDPLEILANTRTCIVEALAHIGISADRLAACGITNQRETTVVWDKRTGQPLHNAIVWHDTRTSDLVKRFCEGEGPHFPGNDAGRFRSITGLPLSVYFSGLKLKWLLENVEGLRELAEAGHALFGTIDSWLLWNLTGGPNGGVHATDVSNASRTLLMDLKTLDWCTELLENFKVPRQMLPKILSSSEIYGLGSPDSGLLGVKISGILGDQQAALFGQTCLTPGEGKNTYGTGCFFILNTGTSIVPSKHGLLTTVGYKIGNLPCVYALEGSIAVAGSLIQWLRDNLGLISNAAQVEAFARTVKDNGGVYFVPAFAGLFAPRWRQDARGCLVGMTAYTNKNHICRAALEAVCYQAREVVDAMKEDSGVALTTLKVDGGMTANSLCMQFQADILGVNVVRPKVAETTALGAAYAAGLAVGFWKDGVQLRENWRKDREFKPLMSSTERDHLYQRWNDAVERSLNWQN